MFNPGDRVRVYGFDAEDAINVLTRTVVSIKPSGLIETDGGEYVHPRQCRRIVKRKSMEKRRGWTLLIPRCTLSFEQLFLYGHTTDCEGCSHGGCEVVRVREVKPSKAPGGQEEE